MASSFLELQIQQMMSWRNGHEEDAKYSYNILGPIRTKIELLGIIYHVAGWEMEFIKENNEGPIWKMKDKAVVNITYVAEEQF